MQFFESNCIKDPTVTQKIDIEKNLKDYQKCQFFTSEKYAKTMLDIVDYNSNLYGIKVLENSCGNGNILVPIVERYIFWCKKAGYNPSFIVEGLERDIVGVELDPEKAKECVSNLNKVAEKYLGGRDVKWKILNKDALRDDYGTGFDYIIGNPPYIAYEDLSDETRNYVASSFSSCKKGKFDYCYAFIESAISKLRLGGKLCFIVPSSIFKNVFGSELRKLLLPGVTIIADDFPGKVFPTASVSPSIFVFQNGTNSQKIKYFDVSKNANDPIFLEKESFGSKWALSSYKKTPDSENSIKFGDAFHVGNSVATLFNEGFLLPKGTVFANDHYDLPDGRKIEKGVVRKAVSPKSVSKNREMFIIFPYFFDNGALTRYTQDQFVKNFPSAASFLQTNRLILDNRDVDSGVEWYEYGRSQALSYMDTEKLMISILFTETAKVYCASSSEIVFSGIYITQNNPDYPLIMAKQILESGDFVDYVRAVGIKSGGLSRRITCNDVKEYRFLNRKGKNSWKN